MTSTKPFEDIALIPHFFNHKWAVDLNRTLSDLFFVLPEYYNEWVNEYKYDEDTYLPGKSQLHVYLAKLLPELRSRQISKVFYCNLLDDFSADVQNAGFVKKFGGILHATNHYDVAVGQNKKLIAYEDVVGNMASQVFVASQLMYTTVPYTTIPIGLPVHLTIQEPKVSDRILFSHRLMADKNVNLLFDLPQRIQDKMTVTCPSGATTYVGKVKRQFKDFHFKIPAERYLGILNDCGVGVSFASHDNFGYSLMEGIFSGLLYLVMDNDTTSYREFVLDELRFKDIDDFVDKYDYYTTHPDERLDVVRRQQAKVAHLQVDQWKSHFVTQINF